MYVHVYIYIYIYIYIHIYLSLPLSLSIYIYIYHIWRRPRSAVNCRQLPDGVRTNGVAEVPQFPLMNFHGKMWANCLSKRSTTICQWHFLHGATRALAPAYPCSLCAYICQHGFCQHGFRGPEKNRTRSYFEECVSPGYREVPTTCLTRCRRSMKGQHMHVVGRENCPYTI